MNYGVGNPKGEKGQNGVSPIVSVEAITGGYEITITDANGTQTFTIMNGQNGTNGTNGQDGITPSISASASVSNSVGTPSVSVVKSGTDATPTFTFNFSNLKGETGTSLISVEVVASLPASGDAGKLYFLSNSGSAPNQYDEYIWVNNAWEKLGTQNIDLSNYIQKSNTSGLVKNDGTIDTTTYTTLNLVYPVGSIYMSVNNTNPSTLFGGTWVQLKDKFLLGAGDTYSNGATGGNVNHNHKTPLISTSYEDLKVMHALASVEDTTDRVLNVTGSGLTDNYTGNRRFYTDNANNMPPYLVVYMWKRTA